MKGLSVKLIRRDGGLCVSFVVVVGTLMQRVMFPTKDAQRTTKHSGQEALPKNNYA